MMKWLKDLKFKYIDCYCRVKVGGCFVVISNAGAVDIGDILVIGKIKHSGKYNSYYNQFGTCCGAFARKLYKKA